MTNDQLTVLIETYWNVNMVIHGIRLIWLQY